MEANAFLGIDVSKGYADFTLLDKDKRPMEEPFQLQDNSEGRKQLKKVVTNWFSKGITTLFCGVESTGGYENNWYQYIANLSKDFNLHVARLNARGVKAVGDASLKRTITDTVSAENIAIYLMSFPEKVRYNKTWDHSSESGFAEGRQLVTYVNMLQKQKVQLANQLEKLLYQYFAEILIYCRHGVPGWLLKMLSRYPCAQAVIKAGPDKLSEIKGITKAKAEALIIKAYKSQQVVTSPIQHVIKMTSKEILHKEELIASEKELLRSEYEDHPHVKLLSSIQGVGVQSSISLMLEIEDVNRFGTCKKLTANFGVHPTFKQSGDGVWGRHMSKKGPGEVRAVLYMTALSGIRCNPLLKQLYARFRGKGMNHYQAMGVVMHKLLRIIYGILKNKTSFDPNIDQANTRRSEEKQAEKEKQSGETEIKINLSKHRYQSRNEEAPISRRQAQKRMKQSASQSS
jgi:transposase